MTRQGFFIAVLVSLVSYLCVLAFVPTDVFVQVGNALILSMSVVLFASYWRFIRYILFPSKIYDRTAIFSISVILMWIAVLFFRLYNSMTHMDIHMIAKEEFLILAQFAVFGAFAAQMYGLRVSADYMRRPRTLTSIYAVAVLSGVALLTLQLFL